MGDLKMIAVDTNYLKEFKMWKLRITSPTQENLLKQTIKAFYGSNIRFEGEQVFNSKGLIEGYRVVKKGSRYRLEEKV